MSWVPLPAGREISVQAGAAYAVVASVKSSHSSADIESIAKSRGLNVYAFDELGADGDGYRFVRVAAMGVSSGSIPWSAPWPLSLVDGSHITQAWVDIKPTTNEAAPGEAPLVFAPWPAAAWVLGLGAAGAAGYAWWRFHERSAVR